MLALASLMSAALPIAAQAPLAAYRIEDDGVPRSLTGVPGDPQRGRAVVANRQLGTCLLCHRAPIPEERFQGDIGPDLAGVGARLGEAQLRLRVIDASRLNPATVMPSYYVIDGLDRVGRSWRGKPVLEAQAIEDVVAYLATLRP